VNQEKVLKNDRGMRVTTGENGEQAVHTSTKGKFDITIIYE